MRLFATVRKPLFPYGLNFSNPGTGGAGGPRHAMTPVWMATAVVLLLGLAAVAPRGASDNVDQSQLMQQAAAGEPRAELMLAMAYRNGRYGLPRDHHTAAQWLQRAAEAGDAYAAAALGDAYASADGVVKDAAAAQRWWTQAAESGNVHAQSQLGLALTVATATPEQKFAGYRWLEQASAAGDTAARTALGADPSAPVEASGQGLWSRLTRMFDNLSMNGQSADSLLARARAGDSDAQYELALRYRDGAWGVDADPIQALAWLRQAAHHGNAMAMLALSDAYRAGQLGLAPNPAKAEKWHHMARLEQASPAVL